MQSLDDLYVTCLVVFLDQKKSDAEIVCLTNVMVPSPSSLCVAAVAMVAYNGWDPSMFKVVYQCVVPWMVGASVHQGMDAGARATFGESEAPSSRDWRTEVVLEDPDAAPPEPTVLATAVPDREVLPPVSNRSISSPGPRSLPKWGRRRKYRERRWVSRRVARRSEGEWNWLLPWLSRCVAVVMSISIIVVCRTMLQTRVVDGVLVDPVVSSSVQKSLSAFAQWDERILPDRVKPTMAHPLAVATSKTVVPSIEVRIGLLVGDISAEVLRNQLAAVAHFTRRRRHDRNR